MKPNLFIIGAPKCGTSALAKYLSEHPNVFFSEPKEPFFLCEDYPHLRRQHFLDSEADYLQLFADAEQGVHSVVGEGSTNYLRSKIAVQKALALTPDAKFIAMLRNPVDVAHAFHMEQLFARNEDEPDFETAWRLQDSRAEGDKVPSNCRAPEFLQYREIADFPEQMRRFFSIVPSEQRMVILQEDFARNTASVYRETLSFLGLPDDDREAFEPVNSSHAHRSRFIADLVLSPPAFLQPALWGLRGYLRRTKLPIVDSIKSHLRAPKKRDPISPSFRLELVSYFSDGIIELEGILGRELSIWSK